MAVQKCTSRWFAPGVTVEETFWGFLFEGAAPDLVANDIIEPEWLPGHGDNGKTSQHVLINDVDEPRLITCGAAKKSRDTLSDKQALIHIMRQSRGRFAVGVSSGGNDVGLRTFGSHWYYARLLLQSENDVRRALASKDKRTCQLGIEARALQIISGGDVGDFVEPALTALARDLVQDALDAAARRTSTKLAPPALKRRIGRR